MWVEMKKADIIVQVVKKLKFALKLQKDDDFFSVFLDICEMSRP